MDRLYLNAEEAEQMGMDLKALFIDVWRRADVAFLGLPREVDVHIPYMVMPMMASFNTDKGTLGLGLNPDFLSNFENSTSENGVSSDIPIILMCRLGSRSTWAADLLADFG